MDEMNKLLLDTNMKIINTEFDNCNITTSGENNAYAMRC